MSLLKRALFWPLALLLAVFGATCAVFPLVMLSSFDNGPHLLDDTRAAWGAGTGEGVPTVSRVSCVRKEHGATGRRSFRSVEYDCEFELDAPDSTPPRPTPDYAGMTLAEQQSAYAKEMEAYLADVRAATAPRGPLDPPSSVRRTLPTSALDRPVPLLRRLSPDGEPPRYGLVFPDGGLARRWGDWTWQAIVFWAFAFGCFIAIPALRRKTR